MNLNQTLRSVAVRQNTRGFRSLVNGNLTRRSAKSICFCSSGGFCLFSGLFFRHIPIVHLSVAFSERRLRQTTASSHVCLHGEPVLCSAACSGWHYVGVYILMPQTEPIRNYMKSSCDCKNNLGKEKSRRKWPRSRVLKSKWMNLWERGGRMCELCSVCKLDLV